MVAEIERNVAERSAVLKKELGLFDLVLAQVVFVVGTIWVGWAAKLGYDQNVFWLIAIVVYYIPLAAVVIFLNRLAPLEAGRRMADIAPEVADSLMGKDADPAGRAVFIEAYAATAESTYRAAVQCLVTFDERANLPNIKVPVLCLAAEHDRNAPASVVEKMAGKIPGAYYFCLSGLGHMPNLEAPQVFDAAIFNFLDHALAAKR